MSLNTIKKSETEMTKMPSFGMAVDQPRISYTDGGCSNWYKHFGKLWYQLSRSNVILFQEIQSYKYTQQDFVHVTPKDQLY